jgi:hypothetical protein
MADTAPRVHGKVVDVDFRRAFAFVREVNGLGQAWGPRRFVHRGSLRGAAHERVKLPPLGAKVTYIVTIAPDGHRRADDVVVEEGE